MPKSKTKKTPNLTSKRIKIFIALVVLSVLVYMINKNLHLLPKEAAIQNPTSSYKAMYILDETDKIIDSYTSSRPSIKNTKKLSTSNIYITSNKQKFYVKEEKIYKSGIDQFNTDGAIQHIQTSTEKAYIFDIPQNLLGGSFSLTINNKTFQPSKLRNLNDITAQAAWPNEFLYNSGRNNSNAFVIAILGVDYTPADSVKYRAAAKNLADKIMANNAFSLNKDKINIIRVDNQNSYEDFGCVKYGNNGNWCKNETAVASQVEGLNVQIPITIINDDSFGVGFYGELIGGSNAAAMQLPTGIIHELGHGYFGLWDEYVYVYNTKSAEYADGFLFDNCRGSCSDFPEPRSGCTKGCSYPTLYSQTPSTIMRNAGLNVFAPATVDYITDTITKIASEPGPPPPPPPPPPLDTKPPVVKIDYPDTWGQKVSGSLNIKTTANDENSISSHKLFLDNTGPNVPITQIKDCGAVTSCTHNLNVDTLKLGNDEKPNHFVIVIEALDPSGNKGRTYTEVERSSVVTPPTLTPAVINTPSNNSNITLPVTFKWNKPNGVNSFHVYLGTSIGSFDLYNKSQSTAIERTINTSDLSKTISSGQKIYARLWTSYVVDGLVKWVFNDYSYTYTGGGSGGSSILSITGRSTRGNTNTDGHLSIYLDKNSQRVAETTLPGAITTRTLTLNKKISKGNMVSIAFDNDTFHNGQYNSDRNIYIYKIVLDNQVVYERVGNNNNYSNLFNMEYNRSNKENGGVYEYDKAGKPIDWGNIPGGYWDTPTSSRPNVGKSPFPIHYMWWNGAVNFSLK